MSSIADTRSTPFDSLLDRAKVAIGAYVAISLLTLGAVIVLSFVSPAQATSEAWGHAIIVAVVAFLLPLRFRAGRRGNAKALRAALIIAIVIGLANAVEALLPGTFPTWMRLDMAIVAALMLCLSLWLRRVVSG